MEKELTPKLKSHKKDLDSLYKKMSDLQWELATLSYNVENLKDTERRAIEKQIKSYQDIIDTLISRIEYEVLRSHRPE